METHLSASATSDNRSEGSSREIGRNVLQDLLPPNTPRPTTFHIASHRLYEFGFQRIHERSDDVHFDPEIPNGDVDGMNVREREVLLVVVQDVPFHFYRFVGQQTLSLQIYLDFSLNSCLRSVGSGHTKSVVSAIESGDEGECSTGHNGVLSVSVVLKGTDGGSCTTNTRCQPVLG